MKDKYKIYHKILWLFFTITCLFLFINKTTLVKVKAVSEQDVITNIGYIQDGITEWNHISSSYSPPNQIGQIKIGRNAYLGYTFGAARNSSNKIQNGDTTITKDSSAGTGYLYNSKINIFINQNGYYYGILHQAANSFIGTGGYPERSSDTSLDFAYVNGNLAFNTKNYGILTNLKNKVFFTGIDKNGNVALKIGGYLTTQNLYAKILLRPSPSGAPIVQRELYLYNPKGGTQKTKFQIYFGEDTSIDSTGSPAVDDVPLYAMGNDEGLFMFSAKDPSTSNAKLYVTNDVPDGFTAYMGKTFDPDRWNMKGKSNIGSTTVAGGDITTPNLNYNLTADNINNGDNGRPAGSNLLYGKTANGTLYPVVDKNVKQDSAYTLRWDTVDEFNPGETLHYASTLGASLAGYSLPQVSKTYTNDTFHADGLNHIGDTLHFTLAVQNNGLKSLWSYNRIQDALPDGLTIDPDSVKYKWTGLTTSGSGSGQVDKETVHEVGTVLPSNVNGNVLDFTPTKAQLADKDKYYITFDALIGYDAVNNRDANGNITNSATFTGVNLQVNDGNELYTADVDIPIAPTNFKYMFKKLLRNTTTNADGAFTDTAEGKKDDIIEYQTKFSSIGSDSMKSARYTDTIPDGLELDPESVTVGGVKQDVNVDVNNPNSFWFTLGSHVNNSNITVTFKAKVKSMDQKTVSNTAIMTNVLTSANETYNDLPSSRADLNIAKTMESTSFVEVPSTIDFGSINSANLERIIPNVKTEGRLIVNHTLDTPFQVSVAYDNDTDAIASDGEKLVNSNDTVLFLNQGSASGSDNWQPLSTTGTSINADGFSGPQTNYDLTDYVRFNKWKLRVPANAKAGAYAGKITWSISDTP
ncbi:cell surface protein precursor [Companilactobacillus mindensis DSM 14500]|uniref:Cell surface protein n=1 Tax=Companilactobacillus mindensis DSM 14500 TaxID=1423770 RepID=A0A0R1QEU2_9LACO|nr:isopeptide-forming domain-containing fimbrial protein [Companilactobacillus mindensis]KRL42942.1 cell surface protein precursor [Companilactobacillus mindensis DSM 14500]GEO79804.1 hypothetical protein LMI01_21350 [Companilactobacillus mindensis]